MVRRTIIHQHLCGIGSVCIRQIAVSVALVLGLTLSVSPAVSQSPTLLNPSKISEDTEGLPAVDLQPALPALSIESANDAPENAADIRFTLSELRFTSAAAFPDADLRALWPYQAGDEVSIADVFTLADAITNHYRKAGYALSFALVPAQQITEGIVQIEIVEGFLDEMVIQSPTLSKRTARHIANSFQTVRDTRPVTSAALERFLLLVNDLPGIEARGTISPGTAANSSVLTLEVEQTRLSGAFGYNDYLSDALGNDILLMNIAAHGQYTGRDTIRLSASRTPQDEIFHNSAIDYETYLTDQGLQLFLSTSESSTRPQRGTLAATGFESDALSHSLSVRYPLRRGRLSNLFIGGEFTISDSTSRTAGTTTSEDKTRTAAIYADYDYLTSSQQKLIAKFLLQAGIDGLGSQGNSRQFARTDYQLMGIEGQMLQPLWRDVSDNLEAELAFKLRHMISDSAALAGVECSFGGPAYGSGFESGSFSAENCALASLKLRWTHYLTDSALYTSGLLQFLARLDAGSLRQNGQLVAGEARKQEAASWGVGASLLMDNGMSVAIERSVQIKNEAEPAREGKGRINMRLAYEY